MQTPLQTTTEGLYTGRYTKDMEFTLYKHQQQFLEIVQHHHNYLLAAEQGTGKTIMLIQHLRYLYNKGLANGPTLIICPNIVCENWKREIKKFASERMYQATAILQGTKAERIKILNKVEYCFFIINYEGLSVIREALLSKNWAVLIADEQHKLKNPKAKQAKIAIELSMRAQYRYGATGTPIANNLLDIWNLFMFLDHGSLFGRNFYAFRAKYFQDKNAAFKNKDWYFPKWEARTSALNELQALLATKSFRVLKKDCLDLPSKIYQQVYVDLTPEQEIHYRNIKKELITEFNNGVIVAANALTKIQRLSQITSGLLFNTDGDATEISCAKMTALGELLDQLQGNKIIIWGVLRKELERIYRFCQESKLNPVLIYGGVDDRDELTKRFNEDPACKILIGQVATGVGFNACAAKYAIYFSNSYSMVDRKQSEDRNHRIGSEIHDKINYIDIVSRGTVDEVVLSALQGKADLAKALLDDIRR